MVQTGEPAVGHLTQFGPAIHQRSCSKTQLSLVSAGFSSRWGNSERPRQIKKCAWLEWTRGVNGEVEGGIWGLWQCSTQLSLQTGGPDMTFGFYCIQQPFCVSQSSQELQRSPWHHTERMKSSERRQEDPKICFICVWQRDAHSVWCTSYWQLHTPKKAFDRDALASSGRFC